MEPEPGEEIFFHGHPSWRSILGFYAKGLLAALAIGIAAGVVTSITAGHVQAGWIVAVMLVVFAVVLITGLLKRIATTYSITNERLTIDHGLLSREVHETRLERVQNVNATQSLLERLLRVGTVEFDTAAEAEYDFSFKGVGDPQRIVRTVDRALRERAAPDARGTPAAGV